MSSRKILVWDVPTRVFHWLLTVSFAGAFLTSDSERQRDLHILFGLTLLALITFRLVWGVVGTRYARFASFAFSPRAVLRYLRGVATLRGGRYLGHTPAGSWAIWLMLGLGILVGLSGYAAQGDGPEWLEETHGALAWTLLAVVVVHVAGVVLSSLLHRENLVAAMITGRKRGEASQAIRRSRWLIGAALAALVLGLWLDVVPVPGLDGARGAWSVLRSAGDRGAHEEDD
ncbi:MAG TPA: cytochrome b/b6 domain-containing protein [Methylomirabilota bacterium]|nr:cytochrome b/b6 domain-containing protein [Methylomirabilota bacterium]